MQRQDREGSVWTRRLGTICLRVSHCSHHSTILVKPVFTRRRYKPGLEKQLHREQQTVRTRLVGRVSAKEKFADWRKVVRRVQFVQSTQCLSTPVNLEVLLSGTSEMSRCTSKCTRNTSTKATRWIVNRRRRMEGNRNRNASETRA